MKLTYSAVFEQTPNNHCAYAPDVPGCIATGKTWNDIQTMIKEAIAFHIEDMQLAVKRHRLRKCRWQKLWPTIVPFPATTADTFPYRTTWTRTMSRPPSSRLRSKST